MPGSWRRAVRTFREIPRHAVAASDPGRDVGLLDLPTLCHGLLDMLRYPSLPVGYTCVLRLPSVDASTGVKPSQY